MSKTFATVASVLVVGGVAAAPAQAERFNIASAKFKVEVEGVQTTAWNHSHSIQFECDSNSKGEGTEVVRFKSRPTVLGLSKVADTVFWKKGRKFDGEIDLPSTITRRGTYDHWGGKVCSYGDGTGTTQQREPDCGTKRSSMYVELRYSSAKKGLLMLEQGLIPPLGPFFNCPVAGVSWPSFLDRTPRGELGRRLPVAALLGPSRKHIILVSGRDERRTAEDWHQTTIRYSVSLTRLGKVSRSYLG